MAPLDCSFVMMISVFRIFSTWIFSLSDLVNLEFFLSVFFLLNWPSYNMIFYFNFSSVIIQQERCRLPDEAKFNPHESFWKTFKIRDVVWNFEKFLVDSNGVPVLRFLSTVEPMDILKISKLLLNDPSCNSCLETELKILESMYPKKWRPPYLCPNPTTSSGKRILFSLKYFFVFVFFLVNFNFFHM